MNQIFHPSMNAIAKISIILGGLLSMANQFLKPWQEKSIEIDTKRQILGAVIDVEAMSNNEILAYYDKTIKSVVVDFNGDLIDKNEKGNPIIAEDVSISQNFKKKKEDRQYPVFIYHKEGEPEAIEAYILPMYGTGLWGPIWGFVALETDFNTVKGAVFDHEGETPGLGARITTKEVQSRFIGKKIYDEKGDLESVTLLKGENNPQSALDEHHINGMSGATITGRGLSKMIKSYLENYQSYIDKTKSSTSKVASL